MSGAVSPGKREYIVLTAQEAGCIWTVSETQMQLLLGVSAETGC